MHVRWVARADHWNIASPRTNTQEKYRDTYFILPYAFTYAMLPMWLHKPLLTALMRPYTWLYKAASQMPPPLVFSVLPL